MTTYAEILTMLDVVIAGQDIGAHGPFWRTLSRDEFVAFKVFGVIPLLATDAAGKFDPLESNLIKALQGRNPFSRDLGDPDARFPRMPAGGLPPMSDPDIETIKNWISAGCPEAPAGSVQS